LKSGNFDFTYEKVLFKGPCLDAATYIISTKRGCKQRQQSKTYHVCCIILWEISVSKKSTLQDAYITKCLNFKTSNVTRCLCHKNVYWWCTEQYKPPPTHGPHLPASPRPRHEACRGCRLAAQAIDIAMLLHGSLQVVSC
jgi:hypothetical protein